MGSLTLLSSSPNYSPTGDIEGFLRTIALIAAPLNRQGLDHSFYVGKRFLEYVSFLGCSPNLKFSPSSDNDLSFCHIQLIQNPLQTVYRTSKQTRAPQCPNCRYRVEQWQAMLESWQLDPEHYVWCCPNCALESPLPQLRWQHSIGFARYFIRMADIYPYEAVPAEKLLNELQEFTQTSWTYFYEHA